jgi:Nucleotidyl transferase of unknown function (DUF2204)
MASPNSGPIVSSSLPPDLSPQQEQLYREILVLLNRSRIPYAVSGAFALQQFTGIWRTTKDLDVFITAKNASAALDLLHAEGFRCEVCDPIWLAKAHRDGYFVDFITGMSNGAITVADSWIERSTAAAVLDVPSRTLAPEELLVSKLFVTRRERFDGADIAHIIFASKGSLNWDRVMTLAGPHSEVLLWALQLYQYIYPAQSSYVPAELWTKLIDQLRSNVLNPNPHARFRGSLIDENMFAIDIHEWGLDDLLSECRANLPEKITWTPPPGDRSQHGSDHENSCDR